MWIFDGEYSGDAKKYIKQQQKRTFVIESWIISIFCILAFGIMAIILGKDGIIWVFTSIGLGVIALILSILLLYFVDYKRIPKRTIEIANDGISINDSNGSYSFAFYKLDNIEYHEDFIAVNNKFVLQKDLLIKGEWEELKSLLKKVEESLESDTPIYQLEEPSAEFVIARVKSKRIYKKFVTGVTMVTPVSSFQYFIAFALESGEDMEYEVSKEWYEQIKEGQTGTLVLVNGAFFDFGDGEEVE